MAVIEKNRDYLKDKRSRSYHLKPVRNPLLFQAINIGHLYYGKKHVLERDKEQCFDLRLFITGIVKLTYKGKQYLIKAPKMVFLDHFSDVRVESFEGESFEECAMYIIGPHLDEFRNSIIKIPDDIYVEKYEKDSFINNIETMLNLIEDGFDVKKMSTLIYSTLIDLAELNKNAHYSKAVEGAIRWIDGNYYQDIDLNEVAKSVSYSYNRLNMLFKNELGMTLMEYVRKVRLEKGLILLTSTSKTITTISQEIGFSDRRSFVSYFKKMMGITPYEYRSQYRQYDGYS